MIQKISIRTEQSPRKGLPVHIIIIIIIIIIITEFLLRLLHEEHRCRETSEQLFNTNFVGEQKPTHSAESPIFTALHGMQTRSCDENSVCPSVRPSVCPSVKRVDCDKTEERYV